MTSKPPGKPEKDAPTPAISLKRIGWIVAVVVLIYFYSGARAFASDVNPAPARINWNTILTDFKVDSDQYLGQRFSFQCPERTVRDEDNEIFGTYVYSSESPICVSAVHAGVIERTGGEVLVQLNPGINSYYGSVRNELKSGNFPQTRRSIVFVEKEVAYVLDPIQRDYAPRLRWETRFTRTAIANRDLVGQHFVFRCPAAPAKLSAQRVSGTDRYSYNSFVCLAGVHAGQMTAAGGFVSVQIIEADGALKGSIRNGIESRGGGAGTRQLVFSAVISL